jgi:hypothetical protein
LQECLEFRQRGRVLEQEQVPSFVAAQLGSADARCDAALFRAGAIPS